MLERAGTGSALVEARENEVEVFHDYQSLNDWWRSENPRDVSDDIDFSTSQAVGVVTRFASEGRAGYFVDGLQWADEEQDEIVIRIDYDCPDPVIDYYFVWEVWVTPVLPVSTCQMAGCEE